MTSPLYKPVEGPLILGTPTWEGIAHILSADKKVRVLQLESLQAPFQALFDEQGCRPQDAGFCDALKPLVSQLVVRLTWLWKKNLLRLQEGYLSHKKTSV